MSEDARRFSPSVERNRAPILAALRPFLPAGSTVLEIASGSGEHAAFLCEHVPEIVIQPTDRDPDALASIAAWRAHTRLPNLLAPLELDVRGAWPDIRADIVLSMNMIHIAPWTAAQGLLRGAAQVLLPGGRLLLYGPFFRRGHPVAPSNLAFDADLRERDPSWGIRDIDEVAAETDAFLAPDVVEMPANNLLLVFALA